MTVGDCVSWHGMKSTILLYCDDGYFCLSVGTDGAQLVHVSELEAV